VPSTLTVVSAVNFNAPGQVVIAGAASAVARAQESCKARGAKRALPLPVSVPSHCALMRPAAQRFAEAIAAIDWQTPQIPLVQNVSATLAADLGSLKQNLLAQLYSPVRWTASMQTASVRLSNAALAKCSAALASAALKKHRCSLPIHQKPLPVP